MTAPIIPAGAGADLASLLLTWRTVINAKLGGGLKMKTADTSRNNTTTYADDPHLTVAVAANTNYRWKVEGVYQAGAGNLQLGMTFPAGATIEAGTWGYDPGTNDWQATTMAATSPHQFVTGLTGTGGNVPFKLGGALFVGATAGSLTLRWSPSTLSAVNTILRKGTTLELIATT